MSSRSPRPSPAPPRPCWVADPEHLVRFHQFQGVGTHDCGPTALAVVLNLLAHEIRWHKEAVDRHLWRLGRPFPSWIRGATPPWRFVRAFNRLAARSSLPWRARWHRRTPPEALFAALAAGRPFTLLLVWADGGAHYGTVVGYAPAGDRLFLLDPAQPEAHSVAQPWAELWSHWDRQVWWTRLLGLRRVGIEYVPD